MTASRPGPLLPTLPAPTLPQGLASPDPRGLSGVWGCLQQAPIVCWPACTCSTASQPGESALGRRWVATPHHLKSERGPFFSFSSSFLSPLSMKWSSPLGSREHRSLPGFLESPWPGDRVGPKKQRDCSLGLAKAPELLRVMFTPSNSPFPVGVPKSGQMP